MEQNWANKPQRRRTRAARTLRHRLTLTEPISFARLVTLVRPHLTAGLTAKSLGADGSWGTWSPSTVKSAWSDVVTGLVHAVLPTLPSDEQSEARARHALEQGVAGADVRPFLHLVPDAVGARRATPDARRSARARAGALLAALIAGFSHKAPLRLRTACLMEGWKNVLAAVRSYRPAAPESLLTGLMHLAVACSRIQVRPEDLPTDARELGQRLAELVPGRQTRYVVRSALGRLATMGVAGVPRWPEPARLVATRRLAHAIGDHLAIARPVVPALVALVERWRALRTTGGIACADTTLDHMEAALLRAVAFAYHAVRAGVVPTEMASTSRLWRWWTELLPIHLDDRELLQRAAASDESLLGETEEVPDGLPALPAVLLWAARSGLLLKSAAGGASGIVPSVRADADAVWRAAQHVAAVHTKGKKLTASSAAERALAEETWSRARAHLVAALGKELRVKNKRVAASMFSLPWALCFALPWWTECELPRLRETWQGIRRRLGIDSAAASATLTSSTGHSEERRAASAYDEGLRQWLSFAAFVADPVRCRNLWAARIGLEGTEITLDATFDERGCVTKIHRVDSHFGGEAFAREHGNPLATLKTRKYGQRHFQWASVAVDDEWLAEYLTRVWLPTLKCRALVPADTTLQQALKLGRFALFVTDGGKWRRPRVGSATPGAYADAHGLRIRFRAALLAAMRAMRLHETGVIPEPIPADDVAAARRWPWLLTPHVVRLWWATHCLGVLDSDGVTFERIEATGTVMRLEPDKLVERATTDRLRTLQRDYEVPVESARNSALSEATDWRHPLLHQREVVDYLVMPSRKPDFATLWDEWALSTLAGTKLLMPQALAQAWRRRRTGTDLRIIKVRQAPPSR